MRLTSTVLKPETTKLIAMDSLFRPAQVDAGQEQHSRVSRFLSCSRSLHGRIPAISATQLQNNVEGGRWLQTVCSCAARFHSDRLCITLLQ